MPTNLKAAWEILAAKPVNIVWSWSAWPSDGSRSSLYVTLPRGDFLPDAPSDIPLWDKSWSNKSPGKAEQWRNVTEALKADVPIFGFIVVQKDGSNQTTDTFPQQLLTLEIVENTKQRIVARVMHKPTEMPTEYIESRIATPTVDTNATERVCEAPEIATAPVERGTPAMDAGGLLAAVRRIVLSAIRASKRLGRDSSFRVERR